MIDPAVLRHWTVIDLGINGKEGRKCNVCTSRCCGGRNDRIRCLTPSSVSVFVKLADRVQKFTVSMKGIETRITMHIWYYEQGGLCIVSPAVRYSRGYLEEMGQPSPKQDQHDRIDVG